MEFYATPRFEKPEKTPENIYSAALEYAASEYEGYDGWLERPFEAYGMNMATNKIILIATPITKPGRYQICKRLDLIKQIYPFEETMRIEVSIDDIFEDYDNRMVNHYHDLLSIHGRYFQYRYIIRLAEMARDLKEKIYIVHGTPRLTYFKAGELLFVHALWEPKNTPETKWKHAIYIPCSGN